MLISRPDPIKRDPKTFNSRFNNQNIKPIIPYVPANKDSNIKQGTAFLWRKARINELELRVPLVQFYLCSMTWGMQRKRRTPFYVTLGHLREFLGRRAGGHRFMGTSKLSFRKRTYFYSFRDQRKRSKVKLCHTNSFETYARGNLKCIRFFTSDSTF
ncbi:hypothetical protein CEXT_565751 [Caerostris extrusa]|uniref:Ribosomal protein S19 n=1 Tax=Caerostris extrusa TaxID=172846 RepID=A0AAV4QDF2_CAEEX|nr:hypothetical protein CEXT_565751 [Caerostris extrusa]